MTNKNLCDEIDQYGRWFIRMKFMKEVRSKLKEDLWPLRELDIARIHFLVRRELVNDR